MLWKLPIAISIELQRYSLDNAILISFADLTYMQDMRFFC